MNNIKDIEHLQNQLAVARQEINNLRKQIGALSHIQQKDILNITNQLNNFKCSSCKAVEVAATNSIDKDKENDKPKNDSNNADKLNVINFKPIGMIRTVFSEKRAVPRQTNIGERLLSFIEIDQNVFNNPEHSLVGLEEFSHLWIIYNFHKNTSHEKSKVTPPRLNGKRIGVFSTRSPHRPCPIGLSIVEICKIDGSCIHFYGTDMIDGTPVLDIKPYIPSYDIPYFNINSCTSEFYNCREEPDGEEASSSKSSVTKSMVSSNDNDKLSNKMMVKVPDWILTNSKLTVQFNERSEIHLTELNVDKKMIEDILAADPRSLYLRTRYGSQIFTFQFGEVTVTCKFDDHSSVVTVVQIRKTENVCDNNVSPSTSINNT